MVTYNVITGTAKFNAENNLTQLSAGVKLNIASIWNATLYYKITIANQGSLGWTFDDGTTEKSGTLNAGANVLETLTLVTSNIPTETTKDSLQLKITYYKNSDFTGQVSEDTVNVTAYVFIQQSDGTWGSADYPEDVVLFDKLDRDKTTISNLWGFDFDLGRVNLSTSRSGYVYVSLDEGVLHQNSIEYYKSSTCSGSGNISMYFKDKSDNSNITDKILLVVTKSSGDGSHRFEVWENSQHLPNADYTPPSSWNKAIISLNSADWVKIYISNGACHASYLWIDAVYIFNKF
ncbi:hypothetical protein [Thermococcus sp.]|uniref:hypothetical protein n=1 Tax=Thermococcus sp. TaxID=35749 RepID=UPI0025F9916A|nr:hypothetical protein [Thermococcus sp.]